MNLDKIKPETLAAGVMDYMPSQSAVAHEYAERLNAALARLGLTERLTLPSAPATAIDELPAVVDVPLRKTLSVLMGKAQQGDASALATLEWTAQVAESIFAGLHARASVYPLALPSHESLATLSQGVDALRDRKIGGVPEAPDGIGLVQLICSDASSEITELTNSTINWIPNKSFFTDKLASLFANLSAVTINCKEITTAPYEIDYWGEQLYPNYSIIYGEGVERIYTDYGINKKDTDTFVLPKVKTIAPFKTTASGNIGTPVLSRAKNILAPELEEWCLGTYNGCGIQGDELRKFYAPKLKGISRLYGNENNGFVDVCPKLIHLEVGEGFVGWYGWEGYTTPRQTSSINFKKWEATMALRTDTDAEDYVDLREDMSFVNNLEQFLSNFKTYIADRVADMTGKIALTLTLSSAVYAALEEQEGQTILATLTNKNWTVASA